ncbi:uncharacterized protein LOC104430332 [Eucalyptus grandis]|uniref:uncharacterized protein LOC104430332 n=1 Tax=Eucalyptus grandis TaxID=71139 RepID=UPI0005253D92|nr:uncharacterized protein LOC104430332 [Eucalyptus grandis]
MPIQTILSGSNYILWAQEISSFLKGCKLWRHVTGSIFEPSEAIEDDDDTFVKRLDKRRIPLEFQVGEYVFLKVSSMRGTSCFGKKGKLSPRYIGPFEILERMGTLVYCLALSSRLAQVHDVFHVLKLRRYEHDPTHVLNFKELDVDGRVLHVKRPFQIVDQKKQMLRKKMISLVKVVWQYHGIEGAT